MTTASRSAPSEFIAWFKRPELVIQSRDYLRMAATLPHVLDRIDPPQGRAVRRVYEAIFLEVVDEHGVPYIIVSNSFRGEIAGTQWARSERLYPYEHL